MTQFRFPIFMMIVLVASIMVGRVAAVIAAGLGAPAALALVVELVVVFASIYGAGSQITRWERRRREREMLEAHPRHALLMQEDDERLVRIISDMLGGRLRALRQQIQSVHDRVTLASVDAPTTAFLQDCATTLAKDCRMIRINYDNAYQNLSHTHRRTIPEEVRLKGCFRFLYREFPTLYRWLDRFYDRDDDASDRQRLRRRAIRFMVAGDMLYKKIQRRINIINRVIAFQASR